MFRAESSWSEKGEKMDFEHRCQAAALIKRKINQFLPAGSPMYYYCWTCGTEMVLPEDHPDPAPRHCEDCIKEGRAGKEE